MKKSEKIVRELSDEELMDITGGATYMVSRNYVTFNGNFGMILYGAGLRR